MGPASGTMIKELADTTPVHRALEPEFGSDVVIYQYLERCEACVYGGLIDSIVQDRTRTDAEKILALLSHHLLGNRDNKRYLSADVLSPVIENLRRSKLPLQFVLPSFPFKDQNPFRAAAKASHVDLGEIGLLIRLHTLALALDQVYPFGVEWIIVCDGHVYAPIFGIPPDAITAYQKSTAAIS